MALHLLDPLVPDRAWSRGTTWSSYYDNGHVFSSDLGKGFDVLEITNPSLKKAAKVKMDELNPQSQPVYQTR